MTDFFISYTHVDRPWAEWIAWQLEAAGYTTVIQAWDFRPGSNFVLNMQQAAAQFERTIAVLSPAYLQSGFAASEWAATFARDPTSAQRSLVPVRVERCDLEGLLRSIVYIDLVGQDAETASNCGLIQWLTQLNAPDRCAIPTCYSPCGATYSRARVKDRLISSDVDHIAEGIRRA